MTNPNEESDKDMSSHNPDQLAALQVIRESLDRLNDKMDKIQEKMEIVAVDHAKCITKCDMNAEVLEGLKVQAEHSKKFRTQARTIMAVVGVLWAILLGVIEMWRRK